MNDPSPTTSTTGRSGRASLMPSAAPRPQPSDDPPLPNIVPGSSVSTWFHTATVTRERLVHEHALRRLALKLTDAVAKPLGGERPGGLHRLRRCLARRAALVVPGRQLCASGLDAGLVAIGEQFRGVISDKLQRARAVGADRGCEREAPERNPLLDRIESICTIVASDRGVTCVGM